MKIKAVFLGLTVTALSMVAIATEDKGTAKQTMAGYISDSQCGTNVDKACAKRCAKQGAAPVFVDDKDKTVISIANPESVKDLIGEHVALEGTLNDNQLTISAAKKD